MMKISSLPVRLSLKGKMLRYQGSHKLITSAMCCGIRLSAIQCQYSSNIRSDRTHACSAIVIIIIGNTEKFYSHSIYPIILETSAFSNLPKRSG